MNFCCSEFKNVLLYFGLVFYDEKGFGKWVCRFILNDKEFIQSINNCPWCGALLEKPIFE